MNATRRTFLELAGGLSITTLLGGCGSSPSGSSVDGGVVAVWDGGADTGRGPDGGSDAAFDAPSDAIADADARQPDAIADAELLDLPLEPDRGPDTPDAVAAGITLAGFSVTLLDESCSGHRHGFTVVAGTYLDDEPIMFMGGGHSVYYRPSELLEIFEGAVVPFHTDGDGGHGHCGTAVLDENAAGTEMLEEGVDGCQILGDAICSMR